MFQYKRFLVTGSANAEVLDAGIQSTEEQKKRLISVLLTVEGYAGNDIVGWKENNRMVRIPDYLLDTWSDSGGANTLYSTRKWQEIPIDYVLPVGKPFKIGISCGATAKNLYGVYKYEEIT